jgi:hypothetical protein
MRAKYIVATNRRSASGREEPRAQCQRSEPKKLGITRNAIAGGTTTWRQHSITWTAATRRSRPCSQAKITKECLQATEPARICNEDHQYPPMPNPGEIQHHAHLQRPSQTSLKHATGSREAYKRHFRGLEISILEYARQDRG